ncbi:MAG: SprB repeat-containing protein [Flammeovirgaceae bacterium]
MKGTLFVLLCLFSFGFNSNTTEPLNCNSLKVEVETKDSNGATGEISLTASGGQAPYKYVVFKSSGHLISSEDFLLRKFIGLKAGTYQAIVVDENGCKTQLEIELK